ncbi:MAG: BadF/BadG/BcrA/BcrD ATPase family protein [Candidatus Sumerlaeales bacterium]|nr:BadF/BadG/BcrA/BcrD ATPase family protein [Candidatus Sumerlaeales bacterium]
MTEFVIGVDGGGTKTRGAIAPLDGDILAQDEVGSTNYNAYPLETVRENLKSLIGSLLEKVGGTVTDVKAIVLGLSGCDRPEDKPVFINLIKEILPVASCLPVNDAIVALYGGLGSAHGIQVIAGTGSVAYGFDGPDKSRRCGGWGNILGDEGSGWAIGIDALRAIIQAHDEISPKTLITDKVLAALDLPNPQALLGWLRGNNNNKSQIAALSRHVFDAAAEKDEVALAIMKKEATEIAKQAAHVGKMLFGKDRKDYRIVVGGGNLRGNQMYFEMFKAVLAQLLPGIDVVYPAKEPVEGAVLYAQSIAKNA